MLKRKYTYLFLLGAALLSSSSCSKWLDAEPQDGLIQQEFWKTKEHVESAVVGVYISLSENSVVNQLFRFSELRADMIALAPAPSVPSIEETALVQGNILPTNSFVSWANIYKVINNCNLVIDKAPGARNTDPTFSIPNLNSRLAEAKAIRALMYFYLVRVYRDVPLQLEGISEDTQIDFTLEASSPEETLEQILDDLAFAEEHIQTTTYGNIAADKGRITKAAINAMQADVYLWRNDFAKAHEACEKVIKSGQYGLVDASDGNLFLQLYYFGNSPESIFELQYTTERPNLFMNMFYSPRTFIANSESVEGFFAKNDLAPTEQDLRADMSYSPADYVIHKYTYTGSGYRPSGESVAHFIIYRYADVLLMDAEALAHLGKGDDAITLINRVRNRSKALITTAQNPAANDPSGIEDYILDERAREFAFEGKRWFDLLRIAKRNNYAKKDLLINAASMNATPALQQSYKIKLQDPNSHYLPIFFRELQANKNLTQNPFYK